MTKPSMQTIHEYVWKRCVEHTHDTPAGVDDDLALSTLEEYYAEHSLESNSEFYFYAFLLFELAFERAAKKNDYLSRAKVILEKYRQSTGETDWDEIEDRLYDINEALDQVGVLTKVEAAGEKILQMEAPVKTVTEATPRFAEIPKDMVLIPEGTFKYGENAEEKYLPAFLIDRHAVTNRRYGEFLQQAGYRVPKYWTDPRFNKPDQPVVGVSLMDAKKFASWAGCELATEQQYEKAARGPDGRTYPWGNDVTKNVADFAQDPELGSAKPVGSHPGAKSPFGAFDMAGCVWEWTNSNHPESENSKVIKGGSWCDAERYLRTYSSLFASVREKADNLGFRTVKNHP